jgi:hypothetical protein
MVGWRDGCSLGVTDGCVDGYTVGCMAVSQWAAPKIDYLVVLTVVSTVASTVVPLVGYLVVKKAD